ncbi:variant surface glycoprotein [Trypanosoma brucei equiperdum]|uniref:Variant surface glycoprotein n=1 Tax=Trypanosoma brucei equiperdum TaxID=630700 RepID=A0A3L6LET3_9TRYP|nr:variant surface glycoprotein [Trypanosoma brucei equiperdum]
MTDQILKLTIAATAGDTDLRDKVLPALAATGEIFQTCRAATQKGRRLLTDHAEKLTTAARALTIIKQLSQAAGKTELTPKTGAGKFTAASLTTATAGESIPNVCTKVKLTEEKTKFDPTNASDNMLLPEIQAVTEVTINCNHDGNTNNCVGTEIAADNGKLTFNSVIKIGEAAASNVAEAWASDATNTNVKYAIASDVLKTNITNANDANKLLLDHFKQKHCSSTANDYNAVATSDLFKRQLVRSLPGLENSEDTTTTPPSLLDASIKAAYGEGGSKFEERLWKKINNLKPKINKDKTSEGLHLESETDIGKLTEALARQLASMKKEAKIAEGEPAKKKDSEEKTEEKKGGDNTAKPVCSSFQKQTACEAANQGGTKHCGWKGENSDGSDKGTYKCRHSSILLDKQFALSVVSAAFVALLF